ncbi:hypothetical protein BC834DRAFT_302774 [Gloeopeniophorella convolvens]|nr:hypothetical protein BC834DRAFT_302774 [Gloeopeniophorella convolvens]
MAVHNHNMDKSGQITSDFSCGPVLGRVCTLHRWPEPMHAWTTPSAMIDVLALMRRPGTRTPFLASLGHALCGARSQVCTGASSSAFGPAAVGVSGSCRGPRGLPRSSCISLAEVATSRTVFSHIIRRGASAWRRRRGSRSASVDRAIPLGKQRIHSTRLRRL